MGDTFGDLLREVGLVSAATQYADLAPRPRRPMPRSMRPPEQRAADERLAPAERERAYQQLNRTRLADADTAQRQAWAPPRNQIAETGALAAEVTGLPGALRANAALRESDYGRAAGETARGLLNLGTLGLGGGAGPRVMPRLARAVEPVTPIPQSPARQIGPGGLPIRERQPFRQSFMGGSADLRAAAARPPRINDAPGPQGVGADMSGRRVYRGEIDRSTWDEAERSPGYRFMTERPEVANSYARDNAFNGRRYDTAGGRVFVDSINPSDGFETVDLKGAVPTQAQIDAWVADARARGLRGFILENVPERTSPAQGRGRRVLDRQYLVVDESPPGNRPPPPGSEGVGADMSGGRRGIRAYHGSPHDFAPEPGAPLGRFRLDRIGSGEGAQAYGHGLYFAENEGVARSYRLSNAGRFADADEYPAQLTANTYLEQYRTPEAAVAELDRLIAARGGGNFRDPARPWDDGRDINATAWKNDNLIQARDIIASGRAFRGRMYEVNINAAPEDFLDWDAPLRGQAPPVYDGVNRVGRDPRFGIERVSDDMSMAELSPLLRTPGATQALAQRGVPGIRYLDQGSRGVPANQWRVSEPNSDTIAGLFDNEAAARAYAAENGGSVRHITNPLSSNYVVFDDSIIEILRKYGLAGLGMGAAAGAGAQQNAPGQSRGRSS